MKKLLYHLFLLLCSTGLFGQATISLNSPRTAGGTEIACQTISLLPGFSFTATGTTTLTLKADPSVCNPYNGTTENFSTNRNYILTRTYTNESGTTYLDKLQYFDGLGRPIQTVQRGITPSAKDLVTLQEYDAFGRESNAWLPAVLSGNNGAYVAPETIKTNAISSNGSDQKPYSMPVYENSPLNRVLQQFGPGQDWQNNGKAVATAYKTNSTTDALLNCKLYKVTGTNQSPTLSQSTNYATGELYVTEVKDEDGNTGYEFKDKLGQVVLTRQMEGTTPHDTYYVYNDFGLQCFVLPPRIQEEGITQTKLDELAYLYRYDQRNRCIAKKLPGCDWNYYIYDKADRLIYSQDGEQYYKNPKEWTFSIPDAFGRVVLAGTCTNSLDYLANPLADIVVKASYNTGRTNPSNSYTVTGITLSAPTILSVNFYDGYEFLGITGVPNTADTQYTTEAGYGVCYGDHQPANKYKNKGLLAGTLTAQMKPDGTIDPVYLYSVMYYDDRGRVIQTKSNNHLTGGIEKEYIAYNFTGQPTQRKHIHMATGKNTQTEVYAYSYDHAGRLLKTTHQLTDGTTVKPQVTLAENSYDELGRLLTNKKGAQTNLNTTYAYNVRSWTKSITSPLFNQTLYYNDKVTAHSYSDYQPSYNGNISGMEWQQKDDIKRSYRFKYDKLSRLIHSGYNGVSSGGDYNTAYTYDKHGNIVALNRIGKTTAGSFGLVDILTMNYTGNQLTKVDDGVGAITLAESADFKNYSNVAVEYTYNKNGAMTKDLNKGITEIQYNSLNLPKLMDIKSPVAEARNEYTYSAGGQKLKVVQKWNPSYSTTPVIGSAINTGALTMSKTTEYIGNIIYENSTLKRILVDGGYIENGAYYFYLTDHLGNNRVVADASGTAIQKTHYYPFGMAFAEGTVAEQGKQPYKYNGKELDQMHGLNLYDYSARYYEPAIGRFTTVDPLAEKYYSISPYAYCANNPIRFSDPSGMIIDDANMLEWNSQEIKIGFMIWLMEQNNTDGKYDDRIDHMKRTVVDMDKMRASKNVYYLEEAKGTTGGFSYDKSKKKFRIAYLGIPNFIHEITHGGQYERGEIGFYDDGTVSGMVGDIHDEVEAYQAEFAYLGKLTFDSTIKNIWDINVNWIRNQTDGLGNHLYRSMNQGYINKYTQYWYYRLINNQPITISTHPADLYPLMKLEEFTFNKDE